MAKAQIISTIAGNGTNGYSGNGVPATSAGIPDPIGGTFDKYGNYYFADAENDNRVREINTLGIITTVAGNGSGGYSGDNMAATLAELYLPCAVKLDTFGNLYIAESENNRIRKVSVSTHIITTFAGNGIGTFSGDNVQATATSLHDPLDLCFDKYGNLYIVDAQNFRIRKIDTSGIITTIAGIGTAGYSGDGGPATLAQFQLPEGIAIDDTGNIYISDRTSNVVRKINLADTITTIAGNGSATYTGDGIPATAASIVPLKIGFDTSQQLFIADDYNERIYRVDLAGILHLVAGDGMGGYTGDGGPATAAEIDYPSGIAFDPCGNLYIPVVTNHYIRKVTFNPTCNLGALSTSSLNTNTAIFLYPNPATNQITITSPQSISAVSITNLMGQTMRNQYFKSEIVEVNIGSLADGVYFVTVTDETGNKTVRKVIKQ